MICPQQSAFFWLGNIMTFGYRSSSGMSPLLLILLILSQVIPETKRIKAVLVLIVRSAKAMWQLHILLFGVGLNILQLRDHEIVSGEESRLKKQGYPWSCSKCLAISLETVLPEWTWMIQIGTCPRMSDFRSVLA